MKLSAVFLATIAANEIEDMAAKVNSMNTTWTAGVNNHGTFADVKALCGTFVKGDAQYKPSTLPIYEDSYPVNVSTLADSLDLRTAHPGCTVIGKIRDQSSCGSCWSVFVRLA